MFLFLTSSVSTKREEKKISIFQVFLNSEMMDLKINVKIIIHKTT